MNPLSVFSFKGRIKRLGFFLVVIGLYITDIVFGELGKSHFVTETLGILKTPLMGVLSFILIWVFFTSFTKRIRDFSHSEKFKKSLYLAIPSAILIYGIGYGFSFLEEMGKIQGGDPLTHFLDSYFILILLFFIPSAILQIVFFAKCLFSKSRA